ncbi:hypothetical protein H9P43_004173 [Blastocladiella emersonii ATCC 22665]|nr:hypothetical protein H9P43_004173 [Blastocladiella emersonii ATCC 22665]
MPTFMQSLRPLAMLRDGVGLLPLIALLLALLFGRVLPVFERDFDVNDTSIGHKYATTERVSSTMLLVLSTIVPSVLLLGWSARCRFTLRDSIYALNALLTAVTAAMLVTDVVKVLVGRLRPDFLDRCKPVRNAAGDWDCTGADSLVRGGRVSFPSGHSSLTAAGWSFMYVFVRGTLARATRRNPWAQSALALLFWPSILTAISRLCDYRHHWQDVTVGFLLGLAAAYWWYTVYFLPPASPSSRRFRRGTSRRPSALNAQARGAPFMALDARVPDSDGESDDEDKPLEGVVIGGGPSSSGAAATFRGNSGTPESSG